MRKKLVQHKRKPSYVVIGADTSMSSIAGACMSFDGLLNKMKGPSLATWRWNQGEHYFDRMAQAARAENLIHDLIGQLGVVRNIEDIYIAIEEPVPYGMMKRGKSGWVKQQIQMHGSFVGGLLRYGYRNVYEVNTKTWNALIAEEMGTKANKEWTKWNVKRWALQAFDVPDFPDLINSPHGKIPKPETSKAKAVQPDDRYDALGVMAYIQTVVENQLL